MTTKKPTRTTGRTAASKRTSTRRTTGRSTTGYRTTRRRQPKVATTVGAALGMLIISLFTSMSWPARIGVVVLVIVLGLVWMLWSHRAEIRAGATTESTGAEGTTGPTTPAGPTDPAPPTTSNDPTQEPTS